MFKKFIFKTLILATLLLPAFPNTTEPTLEIIAAWKNLVFGFDSATQEQAAIDSGIHSREAQRRPYDGDIYVTANGKQRIFVSIPHVQPQVPYTLAEVQPGFENEKGPFLRAYPNTDLHLKQTCDGIYSVFRIWVQQDCNLLYVIDSGRNFWRSPTQQCPPKVIVFDLLTDTIKYSYIIPTSHYTNEVSIFNGITVLPSKSCAYAKAYITDARGPGLVVVERNGNTFKSWLVYSDYFKADPDYTQVTVANETFTFIDGLYTASPSIHKQVLYFHPFASLTEYAIPLPLVHYERIWKYDFDLDFLIIPLGKRPTQSSIEVVDSRGNLWFTLMDPLAIFCWNSKQPYAMKNFKKVIENQQVFQFVIGLKIRYLPGKGETLVGTSNRLQKHNTNTVNPNEINYRIFTIPIGKVKC